MACPATRSAHRLPLGPASPRAPARPSPTHGPRRTLQPASRRPRSMLAALPHAPAQVHPLPSVTPHQPSAHAALASPSATSGPPVSTVPLLSSSPPCRDPLLRSVDQAAPPRPSKAHRATTVSTRMLIPPRLLFLFAANGRPPLFPLRLALLPRAVHLCSPVRCVATSLPHGPPQPP